ncbi:MAG: heparinase II/III family protein [Acidobacteriia bacterium]|nr:heparinase II/III family protein [Terriglobia bacterium]
MTSRWHNKLARVSQMDWEEIRTRVGQEVHKRSDLVRHRMGMRPGTIRLNASATQNGQFFFTRGEAAERAQLLLRHLPNEAAEIVREADEICQHRFRLLGYDNLDYGPEIDWHLDRVHRKRAPLDPWFKIPFLEFALVGDHKVIWELNRHQHLVTLAKAWLLTKDQQYVRELIAQWSSWRQANPYPLGINWGSTLEIAFRSLSWMWVDHLLADAPQYAGFRADILPVLAFHGRYIERYLSTYFSPNTHLLGEALALFFLGTLYPQMPRASRWKQSGWNIVLYEQERQVRADGVYFEQSLYYHVYALDFFLYARLLAAENDVNIPAAYDGVLLRMLNVVEALAQAGPAEGFGDDDGGRLFNPRRNHTGHMTDPLAIGALAYHRDDLAAARLTEESIWLFGEHAVAEFVEKDKPALQSAAFPDGGLYVLADSEPCAQAMVIDAGPHGAGRCGHGHADALSVRLTMNGARWLVDSGSGVYISSDPADRNTFRGTSAHNTMRVDGVDQAVPDEPFSWTDIPTTRSENWVAGKTFTYFAGSHNGYSRLTDPVTHRRCLLRVNGTLGLVRDVALGCAEHDLEIRWHFAHDVSLREGGARELVASRLDATAEPSLHLIVPEQTTWKTEITRSLLSPAYGRLQPAPVARCEARVKLPAEIATVLIAQPNGVGVDHGRRLASMQHAAVHVYELQDKNESHGFFFALDKQPWSFGPWSSDAEVLYCRIREEKIVQLIAVGGSAVAWQGKQLLRATKPAAYFEWRKPDGLMNAEPEPFSLSPLFQELTGVRPASETSNTTSSSYAEKH